jgi:hypothetical protein
MKVAEPDSAWGEGTSLHDNRAFAALMPGFAGGGESAGRVNFFDQLV